MIMKDFISANDRIESFKSELVDFANLECMGCGRTSEEIEREEGYNDFSFDNNSRTTVCGNWYHHIDCFRDSR